MEKTTTKILNHLQSLNLKYGQYIPEEHHSKFEQDIFGIWNILQLELYYFDELNKKLKEKAVA